MVDMTEGIFLLMSDNSVTQRLGLTPRTADNELAYLHCIILSRHSRLKRGKPEYLSLKKRGKHNLTS